MDDLPVQPPASLSVPRQLGPAGHDLLLPLELSTTVSAVSANKHYLESVTDEDNTPERPEELSSEPELLVQWPAQGFNVSRLSQ